MSAPASDPFWGRVRELFQQVVDLPPADREPLLAACDDAAVRAEVLSLLEAHDDSGDFLAASVWELIDANRLEALAGKAVGPYRLVRPIGEGGMGTVFLAVREDADFEQRVAIKLMRGGADSLVRRFRQERQILAALEHPNIAHLLDGGTTADGLPYLVMEYVDGTPIDSYCRTHALSIHERLRLFLTLCDGVQHAHRNLVIHRDLKPANVLITEGGVAKLLDFGIAKLTSRTADATVTRMMTPDYASPEQLRGDAVSTATDVYSLGVLLYELLTGTRPFEPPRTPDSEPVRASLANHALRGDLENILAMAMHVEPARRYGSVEQFADDVRRHLSGHPVVARRDTFGYRATKFVRRNRLAVAAAIALVLVTSIAFAVTLRQKRIAERRFDEVRTLARSVVFELHDAIAPLPGSTPARELLVRRALFYLDNLARESSRNTELELELARAYLKIGDVQGLPYQANLGDTAGALRSYEKALTFAEAVRAREPEHREALLIVADAHDRHGFVQERALEWADAMREHQAALAIRHQLPHPSATELLALARTWVAIGDCRYIGVRQIPKQWQNVSAQEAYEAGLKVLARVPKNSPQRARLLVETARAHQRLGGMFTPNRSGYPNGTLSVLHHDAALRALGELLSLDPSNATTRRNYADQLVMKATAQLANNDGAGALAGTQEAMRALEPLLAVDPTNAEAQHDKAFALEQMGSAYLLLGRFDDSAAALEQSLAIHTTLAERDSTNRESRRDVAHVLSQMSELARKRGDLASAEALAKRAERVRATIGL
jgi:eukaryotic-like serine/threonine-protein kinase